MTAARYLFLLSTLATTLATILATGLPAQEFKDTFDKDSQSAPKGWTVMQGKWLVDGGQLKTEEDAEWAFLTVKGLKPTDCCIDFQAIYNQVGTQFAGVTARYTSGKQNVTCKIQESTNSKRDFERSYIYENPNSMGAAWTMQLLQKGVPGSCDVRMIIRGNVVKMLHDFDKDGVYDQTITRTVKVSGAGLIGASIWGRSAIDNFEYHTAILEQAPNAVAKIGASFPMELRTRSRRTIQWRMALSLGNKGFPIGLRHIPLTPDPVFDMSLLFTGSLGLAGTTNVVGYARPVLAIPNVKSLVGDKMFAAAITLDPTKPDGIGDISNDLGFEIKQ